MGDAYQLFNPPVPVTCFAYNKDRSQIAVSPNSNEVHIYKKSGNGWEDKPSYVLTEHDKLVTGIDWAPNSNRIVSCSQDRNAYVWTWDDTKKDWKPVLVILRINRAATQVKWSPQENKFAVASSARTISVCYFEQENDWWVSKHIKKPIRSTVLSIDWHPNGSLIAAGASDFKARVFTAAIKGVDSKPESTVWSEKPGFGDCVAEFGSSSSGWVHDVQFSADGNSLAWVSHDSTISVVKGGSTNVTNVRTATLPYRALLWLTPKSIVAGGHDANPTLFSESGNGWSLVKTLDAGKKEEAASSSAKDKFKQMDSRGQENATDTKLSTLHQNAITSIVLLAGARGAVQKFVTGGVDGQLITWDVRSLEQAIAGLKIA